MDTKTKFSKRRKKISIMLFIIACLMLSLFFFRVTLWGITVVMISAILVGLCIHLNRCPNCNTKIRNDDAAKCENCNCDLK